MLDSVLANVMQTLFGADSQASIDRDTEARGAVEFTARQLAISKAPHVQA
jgi:hypothetical protein